MRRRLALRVVRGFLLVVLSLGVYGMHTLGHLDARHGSPPADAHGMNVAQEAAPATPAGLLAFVPDPGVPGFDPTSVCLAVLTALMVVLAIAAWITTRRRTGGQGRSPSAVCQVARPPPKPTSLRLARLSMLRV
ncbi:hypothetical protein ACFLIM_05435 [Nonomuraea sp. M3C6]|uniref:MYXO-CTERM domain-containing protein n=1 Tax=Nonomuraea marmarensis TaxID=3351344 RepID=A0ABW7A5K5_9ACTN